MNKSQSLRAIIEEQFIQSKTGKLKDCEDLIYTGENFTAVIDGFTPKTSRRWNKETGGQAAAKIISEAFDIMPHDYTAHQAADMITAMINDFYKDFNAVEVVETDPKQRIAASFAAISLFRKETWLIGDCQILLGNQRVSNPRIVDRVLSNVRALLLELEILKGATVEQLSQNDAGRKFIMPLLEEQSRLQNNLAAGKYWYPIFDGSPIPANGIIIKSIPNNINNIVLATDGYPVLKDTLKESEDTLQDILLKDPLLFREYKSTKGMLKENVSFDDRAFIKVKLQR